VPGALQDTVTSVAGSPPQVSRSCSGSVVVGSGSVVVGGPPGAVAARARGARPPPPLASATAAPAPTVPMMNLRRVNPGLPVDSTVFESLMARTLGNTSERDVAAGQPATSGWPAVRVTRSRYRPVRNYDQ
jgi:hypothetical protein